MKNSEITLLPSLAHFAMPPLSVGAVANGLLFVSGTPGYYLDGSIDESDFKKQFEQTVVTLKEILERGGSSMHSLVKVNVLLTRHGDLALLNKLYALAFGPMPFPARTTCVVAALPDPRMLLEIECVAKVELK